jgi:hypothetical protein
MHLAVTFHSDLAEKDNPEGVHYGFVYFNDDRRVAYTDEGVEANATGGWGPVTAEHVRLAKEYLEAQGGLLGTRVQTTG